MQSVGPFHSSIENGSPVAMHSLTVSVDSHLVTRGPEWPLSSAAINANRPNGAGSFYRFGGFLRGHRYRVSGIDVRFTQARIRKPPAGGRRHHDQLLLANQSRRRDQRPLAGGYLGLGARHLDRREGALIDFVLVILIQPLRFLLHPHVSIQAHQVRMETRDSLVPHNDWSNKIARTKRRI